MVNALLAFTFGSEALFNVNGKLGTQLLVLAIIFAAGFG